MYMHNLFIRAMAILFFLALIPLTTCGKDSPTKPQAPEPTPPPPPPPAPVATRIEIAPSSATLTSIGQSVQLSARVFDQNNAQMSAAVVTWTSSAVGVATVSGQGLVTAVKSGTATITARSGNASASIPVTVMQSVGSIAIEPTSATLMSLGETLQLTATVLDQNKQPVADAVVSWSSSDEAVAIVSGDGLVTAVKNGTATITGRSGSASATATVTVMQSVGSIAIEPPSATLMSLGETVQLTATVLDQNRQPVEDAAVNWSSSDEDVATVSGLGLVTAVSNGTIQITATAGDVTASVRVTVMDDSRDREALTALYNATDGPSWTDNTLWLSDAPLGDWYGVSTDGNGRVTALSLERNGLAGSLPAELGQLSNLTFLGLVGNKLTGRILPELGQLQNLNLLYLAFNQLSGNIPRELGQLRNLTNLLLQSNRLTGAIPPELGQLQNLVALTFADNNQLSGPLPIELTRLTSLQILSLHGTQICIPPTPVFRAWLGGIDEPGGISACSSPEREGLIALYNTTDGPNWLQSTNWLGLASLGEWHGVTTDARGSVTELVLSANNLNGSLPGQLGNLTALETLDLSFNAGLAGPVPFALLDLDLETLNLEGTQLCVPRTSVFQAWLGGIPFRNAASCDDTRLEYYLLAALYIGTNGPNWTHRMKWLTDAPLGDWHGVSTNAQGEVIRLDLGGNNLAGTIPPELGQLSNLGHLELGSNQLSGVIPSEVGRLANLGFLNLGGNQLTGVIPSELGRLANLGFLSVGGNALSGEIPSELGQLGNLDFLSVSGNALTGEIPSEIGQLGNLQYLYLNGNELTGSIPIRLGRLANLRGLYLYENAFTGEIPSELGQLRNLRNLILASNQFTGEIPSELGQLVNLSLFYLNENGLTGDIPSELGQLRNLTVLDLSFNSLQGNVPRDLGGLSYMKTLNLNGNVEMAGTLPQELIGLGLEAFILEGTQLCAPSDSGFQDWLRTVHIFRSGDCHSTTSGLAAYLTQATQSLKNPVPLVAGEDALLRVFISSEQMEGAGIPPARASFYRSGVAVHTIDMPSTGITLPSQLDEGDLASSANAQVPAEIITPGLEMIIEIDPDGVSDLVPGLPGRLPSNGRTSIEVAEVPPFDLTLVPFLWTESPDRSVLTETENLTAESDLFRLTRDILPVREFMLSVREPVWTSVEPFVKRILPETEVVRVMDGAGGHYMGVTTHRGGEAAGIANTPGFASASLLHSYTIAHELGHNMSLFHAPCGTFGDPSFPYRDGTVGVWGFDTLNGELVPPDTPDLMSYCGPPKWISDYHFTKALRYRVLRESAPMAAAFASSTRSLLLWGGVSEDGELILEPTFAVDAPASPPRLDGPYRIVGEDERGGTLFSLRFGMAEIDHSEGGLFAFIVPVRPDWPGRLERITLSGPEGVATLGDEDYWFAALLLDDATGRIRGILRDWPEPDNTLQSARRILPEPGLEVVISRGIPNRDDW